MKVIDSIWFNTASGVCGIVVGENDMGERKLYAGVVPGFDQQSDEQAILSWGNKVSIVLLESLIAKTKKEVRKMEKCSFCPATTDRTNDGKLPEGWGQAKGNVFGKSFDITFCPEHREETEKKLNIIFKVK